jgi:hypothetical protein
MVGLRAVFGLPFYKIYRKEKEHTFAKNIENRAEL